MNDSKTRIDALQAFGYTEEEARFLYLVATHSGFFVARQFLGFAGTQWGRRTTLFWNRLQTFQHARTCRLVHGGTVFHLFSRKVYREIGHENLRNRREHELEYIRTRIAMLDFVLANPGHEYLETEPAKVAYFCNELGLSSHVLPSKTYGGRYTVKSTVRYFVDRFPMFFPNGSEASRVVTFTYLHNPATTLAGFVHHLRLYLPLFRELASFNFLYLARSEAHFQKAFELFRDLVTIPLDSHPADDLLRYFRIRKAWDLAQYTTLSEGDLIFRNVAKERFGGSHIEHVYRAWKVGRLPDSEIREEFRGSEIQHRISFAAEILNSFGAFPPEREENR